MFKELLFLGAMLSPILICSAMHGPSHDRFQEHIDLGYMRLNEAICSVLLKDHREINAEYDILKNVRYRPASKY